MPLATNRRVARRQRYRQLVCLAMLPAFSAVEPGALAQTLAPEARVDAEREVTILGKYFVQDNTPAPFTTASVDLPRTINDPQPYAFFEAREIELSGATTLEGFLRQNLSMDASNASESQNMFFGGNLSSVNLRGLGDNHTLVLINGRPAPAANFGLVPDRFPQANINNIPVGAVDRIEVLPVGASAIYGGNALGGVINLVLKRTFKGGETRMVYQNPGDTDAPWRRVEASYGFTLEGGRTRVLMFSSYSDQKLLQYQDRPFMRRYDEQAFRNLPTSGGNHLVSATPNIRNTNLNSNLVLRTGGSIGAPWTFVPPGTGPGTSVASLAAGLAANAGRFNPKLAGNSRQWKGGAQLEVGLGPRTKTFTLGIRREMTPILELSADFSISGESHTRNTNLSVTTVGVPVSAVNPFTSAVNVNLPVEGNWRNWSSNVSRQFTVGLVCQLPHEWRAQADYTWNSVNLSYYVYNASRLATAAITADILAGRLNPFVDTSLHRFDLTPYQSRSSYTGASGSNDIALRLAGPLGRLPAGRPRLSLGFDRFQEGNRDAAAHDTYANYPALDLHTAYLGRRQTVHSVAAEANLPVVAQANQRPLRHRLEFQLAARADGYAVRTGTPSVSLLPTPAAPVTLRSDQAHYRSTNPTAGLLYQPLAWLRLRGSHGRAYTAPRYSQLAENPTPSTSQFTVVDPRRNNVLTPVSVVTQGNSALQPERAQIWHGGLIIEPESGPLKGLRVAADYNFFRKENAIGYLSLQQIVDYESHFPAQVQRAPAPAGDPFGVGAIVTLNATLQNLYKAYGDWFDVTARYRRQTAQFGRFEFSARASFGNHHRRKVNLDAEMIEYSNVNPSGALAITAYGPLKLQGNASLTWDYRRATVRWTVRHFGSYRVPFPPIAAGTFVLSQGGEFVSRQTYCDLLVGYRFPVRDGVASPTWTERATHGLEVHVGVDNIFNRIPPFDSSTPFNFSQRGNARLRDFRLMLKKPF